VTGNKVLELDLLFGKLFFKGLDFHGLEVDFAIESLQFCTKLFSFIELMWFLFALAL
jgi:hypothetical protein